MLTTGNDIQFVDILFGISIILVFFAALLTLRYQKKSQKDPSFHRTQSSLINFLCVSSSFSFFVTFFVYLSIGFAGEASSSFNFYYTLIKIIVWGLIPYILYKMNKKIPKKQAPGTLVTDDE